MLRSGEVSPREAEATPSLLPSWLSSVGGHVKLYRPVGAKTSSVEGWLSLKIKHPGKKTMEKWKYAAMLRNFEKSQLIKNIKKKMSHVFGIFWWGLRDTQPVANCMCRSILLAFLTLNATSWGCSVVPLRRSYADSRCVVVIVTRSEGKKVGRFPCPELLGASRVTSTHVIAVHMLLAFTNPKSLVNFLFSKLMSPSTIKLPLLPRWVRQCGVFHVTIGCWMSNRWCIIIPYLLYISTEKSLKSKVTSSDVPLGS